MPESYKGNFRLIAWLALFIAFLDQVSKAAVMRLIDMHHSVTVIKGFFNLVHIKNRGMAFGVMNRQGIGYSPYLFVGMGLVAILLLLFWYLSLRNKNRWTTVSIGLIIGGALGNMTDRLRYAGVIDFLDFHVGKWHWPAFNVADSAITVGVVILFFNLFLGQTRGPGRSHFDHKH